MTGAKHVNNLMLIVAFLLIILLCYLAKNSVVPRQMVQEVFHFMVGQETSLRTAQFSSYETEHFTIKYLPVDEDYLEMIADTAEESYILACNRMNIEPKSQTTIVVYPDNESLAQSFGWDKDEKAMGVYWGGTIRILSPGEWLDKADNIEQFAKEGPMLHEFVHLLVDDITKGNYNRWWTEGIAQYIEKKINGFEFKNPFKTGKEKYFYSLEKLEKNFDNLDQSVAYWESLKVTEYIVSQYGEESLYSILYRLRTGDSMAEAVNNVLGIDFNSFEYKFYQYLENV